MLYNNLISSQYTWNVIAYLRSSLISTNSTCRIAHSKDAHLCFISGWVIWHNSSTRINICKKHLHLQRKQEVTKMVLYVKTSLGSYNYQRRYNTSIVQCGASNYLIISHVLLWLHHSCLLLTSYVPAIISKRVYLMCNLALLPGPSPSLKKRKGPGQGLCVIQL